MNRDELGKAIRKAAYLEGDFLLRSGRRSKYYLDKYRFETQPRILKALAERFCEYISSDTTLIAGAELGGVALAAATSLETGLPFVIIRNSKKDYGTSKLVEGVMTADDRVIMVEDIATTAGQALEAAKVITDTGATLQRIVAVIDRQEGARENVEGAGHRFDALYTSSDLGIAV